MFACPAPDSSLNGFPEVLKSFFSIQTQLMAPVSAGWRNTSLLVVCLQVLVASLSFLLFSKMGKITGTGEVDCVSLSPHTIYYHLIAKKDNLYFNLITVDS